MLGTTTDRLFRVALSLKGLDGAVELFGAVALAVASPRALGGLTRQVVDHHLLGGPHGEVAERFAAGEAMLAGSGHTFAVVYLALHGLVKLGLVVALLRRVRPAYPLAVVVLVAFVLYEGSRAAVRGSVLLWASAALDVVLVVLVVREYRRSAPPPGGRGSGTAASIRAAPRRPWGSRRPPRRGTR
jgi:uncharacterized membrane protein